MKFKILSILLALSAMTFATSPPTDNLLGGILRWVKVEQVNKTNLILAGKEYHGGTTNYHLYVGRVNHGYGIIPGKYVADYQTGWFYYTYYNIQIGNKTNFKVLEYLPGTLSWISSSSEGSVDAIVAGHDPSTKESLYVCRVMKDGNLVIGKYAHGSKSCVFAFFNEQKMNVFEILAVNSLGRLLIEKQGNTNNSTTSVISKILTFDQKRIEVEDVPVDCPQNGTNLSVNIYNSQVTFN